MFTISDAHIQSLEKESREYRYCSEDRMKNPSPPLCIWGKIKWEGKEAIFRLSNQMLLGGKLLQCGQNASSLKGRDSMGSN